MQQSVLRILGESDWAFSGDLMRPQVQIKKGGHRLGNRTGSLSGISKDQVSKILGFEPTIYNPSDGKVSKYWQFIASVEDGPVAHCAIWDYNGVEWSTGGAAEIFKALFGDNYEIPAFMKGGERYGYQP